MTSKNDLPDERLWELEIIKCDDGDLLLQQGTCSACDDRIFVRLHRQHTALLAEHAGLLTHEQHKHAIERHRDRLALLTAIVCSYCDVGHPLRAAIAAISDAPSPMHTTVAENVTQRDCNGLAAFLPMQTTTII